MLEMLHKNGSQFRYTRIHGVNSGIALYIFLLELELEIY